MSAIPTKPTNQFFYKYSSAEHLDRLQSIILKHELYFPTPGQLNDPLEAKPKLISDSISNLKFYVFRNFIWVNPGLSPEKHAEAIAYIENMHRRLGDAGLLRELAKYLHPKLEAHRIYSLSKRWDIMSLWANYGDNHRGICLEFSNSGPPFTSAFEVVYDGRIVLDITNFDRLDSTFFFHKTAEWQHEQEVRILTPSAVAAAVPFDPSLLTKLIMGKDAEDSFLLKILEWARTRRPGLRVAQTEYDPYERKLILKELQSSGVSLATVGGLQSTGEMGQ